MTTSRLRRFASRPNGWVSNSPGLGSFAAFLDRKSTRLNSSHTVISYAVFCLKKKKHTSVLQSHSDLVCRLLLDKRQDGSSIMLARLLSTHWATSHHAPDTIAARRTNLPHSVHYTHHLTAHCVYWLRQ